MKAAARPSQAMVNEELDELGRYRCGICQLTLGNDLHLRQQHQIIHLLDTLNFTLEGVRRELEAIHSYMRYGGQR